MADVTRPVALPTGIKELLFRAADRLARTRFGERLITKSVEVGMTSLGAGNHDYEGNRTGENRLIAALSEMLPSLVALDVGANRGAWALEVRTQIPGSRVIAVEPGSAAAHELRCRAATTSGIHVVQCAVGAQEGEVRLFGTVREGDLASLMPELLARTTLPGVDPEADSELVRMCTVTTLLDEVRSTGFLPDASVVSVLKVDTEGFEFPVLEQAMASGLRDSLQVIQFEFNMHAIAQGQMIEDFAHLLGDDFELFRLAPTFLIPQRDLPPNLANFFGFSNWVAVRRILARPLAEAYRRSSGRMTRNPAWLK